MLFQELYMSACRRQHRHFDEATLRGRHATPPHPMDAAWPSSPLHNLPTSISISLSLSINIYLYLYQYLSLSISISIDISPLIRVSLLNDALHVVACQIVSCIACLNHHYHHRHRRSLRVATASGGAAIIPLLLYNCKRRRCFLTAPQNCN